MAKKKTIQITVTPPEPIIPLDAILIPLMDGQRITGTGSVKYLGNITLENGITYAILQMINK